MAAGYFNTVGGTRNFDIVSNSCADVTATSNTLFPPLTVTSCSTNPVISGTKLYLSNGSYWTVNVITATATVVDPTPTPSGTVDLTPLLGTIMVCAYLFLFLFGFHSGVTHGHR